MSPGVLRGRPVSVDWLDPPGVRLAGDSEAIVEVDDVVARRVDVSPTPTGPFMTAALDPPHVGLVTIASVLDQDTETLVSGDVPNVPGLDVPEGATP